MTQSFVWSKLAANIEHSLWMIFFPVNDEHINLCVLLSQRLIVTLNHQCLCCLFTNPVISIERNLDNQWNIANKLKGKKMIIIVAIAFWWNNCHVYIIVWYEIQSIKKRMPNNGLLLFITTSIKKIRNNDDEKKNRKSNKQKQKPIYCYTYIFINTANKSSVRWMLLIN